jgi:hypothetical protein
MRKTSNKPVPSIAHRNWKDEDYQHDIYLATEEGPLSIPNPFFDITEGKDEHEH